MQPASIEELATAWAEASIQEEDDNVTVGEGHEGRVEGASVEELAAAWSEAQAEYERELNRRDKSRMIAAICGEWAMRTMTAIPGTNL